ncbi:unnamed protein product, partial [marine sediment metagenome]
NYKSLLPYKHLTKDKFTYELSDHLPLWVQLNIDTADEEVDQQWLWLNKDICPDFYQNSLMQPLLIPCAGQPDSDVRAVNKP